MTFDCTELDLRNWVMDFGAMKEFKKWAEEMFDHTTLIAKDDPSLSEFKRLHDLDLIQLRIVDAVGCEKFAELCFLKMENLLNEKMCQLSNRPINKTARILSVEVCEHDGNSAIYVRDHDEIKPNR